MGHANEVASAVAFLVSPDVSGVTGVCVLVDSGHTRKLAKGMACPPEA
jgi:enoyl-[acyl-carrier-protein] reductase (NADH)